MGCSACDRPELVFNKFQGPGIARPNTRRVWRNSAKITFERDTGPGLHKERLFRARSPAQHAHVVRASIGRHDIFGRAGRVNKRTCYHGKKDPAFVENPNPGTPWITFAGHMVQGACYFAVTAARALGVVYLDPCHASCPPAQGVPGSWERVYPLPTSRAAHNSPATWREPD